MLNYLTRSRLGLVILLFFLPTTPMVLKGNLDCGELDKQIGNCTSVSASNDGSAVTVGASVSAPGDSGGGGSSVVVEPEPVPGIDFRRSGGFVPFRVEPGDPITLADLVSFRPDAPRDLMEPDGWMVVGLDTNFYARSSIQVKTGLLLGLPASVRFTPVVYSWTYGDGSSRTSHTPGGTWRAQGITEFDPTPTSHVYLAAGTYFIDLTVGFSPEYRWADETAWTPVDGLVWVPANRLKAVAFSDAKTVLVEDNCNTNPNGPGC